MMPAEFQTADLWDEFGAVCASCDVQFQQFGRLSTFSGRMRTVKCHDDNVLIRRSLETRSEHEVLVVDGAGFLGSALLGDQIAALAIRNGWAGIVIFGAVRDSVTLRGMDIGLKALGTNPKKSAKNGVGQTDVPVAFGNVVFRPGEWIYSDPDGILVSAQNLRPEKNA
jgi:regulator of ribonuclease activity A